MFLIENSVISLTIGECNFNRNFYHNLVKETGNRVKTNLNRGDTLQRCNGSIIPLYTNSK